MVGPKVRAKLTRRILPFVCALFILSFLDRVNLSYAAADMSRDLGFGPTVYGLGAGLFFIGYFVFELPAAGMVARRSARVWLAAMLVVWGFVAAAMGSVHSVREFYIYRILLGIAEAGFFPGIIIYLNRWFPKKDRGRAIGALAVGLPAANLLGGPVSAFLLSRHWLNIPGWRWLFVVEGLPSVLAGIVTYIYLSDHPRQASWLSAEEQQWLEGTLENERQEPPKQRPPKNDPPVAPKALFNTTLLVFALIWFLDNMGVYGFNFWLPMIIKRVSGFSSATVAFIAAAPFIGALIASAIVSLSSDRSGERRFHAAIPLLTFAAGLTLSVIWGHLPWLALGFLCLGALGLTSGTPAFWALATDSGSTTGPNAIAIITSAGALGGFCGPYVMGSLRAVTNSFSTGLGFLAGAVLMAAIILVLATRQLGKRV
jgi:MFS transporter, ACS family, tartrate transporter